MNHRTLTLVPFLLALAPVARAAVIHVPADQSTIQGAIDAALEGDTILVARGTYQESLGIRQRRGLTLQTSGKAVIDASGEAFGLHIEDSERILFEGFTIRLSPWRGIEIMDSIDVTISRCSIQDAGTDGIFATGGRGLLLQRNKIRNCGDDGIDLATDGIQLTRNRIEGAGEYGLRLLGTGMYVEKNRIDRAGRGGILLAGTGPLAAMLSKNRIVRAGVDMPAGVSGDGILVGGTGAVLEKNKLMRCRGAGIDLAQGGGHLLSANRISKSGRAGIRVISNNCLLEGNRIVRPGTDGLQITGGISFGTSILKDNRIDRATFRGYLLNSSGNLLLGNRSRRSGLPGLQDALGGDHNTVIENSFN